MAAQELPVIATGRFSGAVILPSGSNVTPSSGYSLGVDTNGNLILLDSTGAPQKFKGRDNGGIGDSAFNGDSLNSSGVRFIGYRIGSGTNTRVASGNRVLRLAGGGNAGASGIALEKIAIDFEASGDWDATTDTPGRIVLRAAPDGSGTLLALLTADGSGSLTTARGSDLYSHVGTSVTVIASSSAAYNTWAMPLADTELNGAQRNRAILPVAGFKEVAMSMGRINAAGPAGSKFTLQYYNGSSLAAPADIAIELATSATGNSFFSGWGNLVSGVFTQDTSAGYSEFSVRGSGGNGSTVINYSDIFLHFR